MSTFQLDKQIETQMCWKWKSKLVYIIINIDFNNDDCIACVIETTIYLHVSWSVLANNALSQCRL